MGKAYRAQYCVCSLGCPLEGTLSYLLYRGDTLLFMLYCGGQLRGHFIKITPLWGHHRGHFIMVTLLLLYCAHRRGQLIIVTLLWEHHRGHFIMGTLLWEHHRGHTLSCLLYCGVLCCFALLWGYLRWHFNDCLLYCGGTLLFLLYCEITL